MIIDSVRAYFRSTSIMTFVERLVKHAEKLGKDGVTGSLIWEHSFNLIIVKTKKLA